MSISLKTLALRIRAGALPAAIFSIVVTVAHLPGAFMRGATTSLLLVAVPAMLLGFFSLGLAPYLVGGHIDEAGNLVGVRPYAYGCFAVLAGALVLYILLTPVSR